MHGSMIFYDSTIWIIVVYPLFIAGHDIIQKHFLFCRWSSSLHARDIVRHLSVSIHTTPNILASESFQTLLNVLKQLTHQGVMFFQVLLASEIGLHWIFPPILCVKFVRCARTFFILKFKIINFEASKSVSACCIRQSIVIISLNKNFTAVEVEARTYSRTCYLSFWKIACLFINTIVGSW